jgi:hypothetical protein
MRVLTIPFQRLLWGRYEANLKKKGNKVKAKIKTEVNRVYDELKSIEVKTKSFIRDEIKKKLTRKLKDKTKNELINIIWEYACNDVYPHKMQITIKY